MGIRLLLLRIEIFYLIGSLRKMGHRLYGWHRWPQIKTKVKSAKICLIYVLRVPINPADTGNFARQHYDAGGSEFWQFWGEIGESTKPKVCYNKGIGYQFKLHKETVFCHIDK